MIWRCAVCTTATSGCTAPGRYGRPSASEVLPLPGSPATSSAVRAAMCLLTWWATPSHDFVCPTSAIRGRPAVPDRHPRRRPQRRHHARPRRRAPWRRRPWSPSTVRRSGGPRAAVRRTGDRSGRRRSGSVRRRACSASSGRRDRTPPRVRRAASDASRNAASMARDPGCAASRTCCCSCAASELVNGSSSPLRSSIFVDIVTAASSLPVMGCHTGAPVHSAS